MEGYEFTLERVWERIRFYPKWLNVAPVTTITYSTSGSKSSRAESSFDVSDAHTNIDLNAGSDAFTDEDVSDAHINIDINAGSDAHHKFSLVV